jgi:cobalt-zinc-cadmium efflux system outer membrane protein
MQPTSGARWRVGGARRPRAAALRLALFLAAGGAAAAAFAAPPPTAVAAPDRGSLADDPFAGQPRLEREALLRAVVERNPGLEALRQAWRAAAAHRLEQAGLPDPTVALEVTPFAAGGAAPFAEIVDLRLPLPLPARRRLRVGAAEAAAAAALAGYRAALVELVATASLLYDDYYMAYRALAISDEHLRLAEELRRAAMGRYAAGLAPQQDPLQAEVEAARLLHRRGELELERDLIAIRIQGLVHTAASGPLPPPPEQLPLPPPLAGAPLAGEQEAVAAHPEVAARRAAADAWRADYELARLAHRPDLEVMGSYDSRWGPSGQRFIAGVAIGLPVRGERLAAERAVAEARVAQAESERAAAEDRIRATAREAALRLVFGGHVREIYEERLKPASRDQLRAARASFEVGKGTLQAVLEAERNLREAELGSEQALVDLYRRQTELDRALGRLPAGLDLGPALSAPGASTGRVPGAP